MGTRPLAALIAAAVAACGFESPPDSIPPPNADPQGGCAIECHGDSTSNAPPKSMSGATETTSVAVGAHRAHLNVASTWHRMVECGDCHIVPATVDAPGHLDGDNVAEVTFAMIAGNGAAWNGTTCQTRCHGSAEIGGAQPMPTWTRVDGSQVTCGSCHGRPPPAPHPTDTRCASCHPTMEEDGMTFRVPDSHINGMVEQVPPGSTGGCASCHGTPGVSSAPPKDLMGNTDKTTRGVGAHTAHLAPSTWHRQGVCADCHKVPLTVDSPGHRDDGNNMAEVLFTNLNRQGAYVTGTATCTTLYCHGNGQGNNGTKSWITPGALACGACHSVTGAGMSGKHQTHIDHNIKCSVCHSTVIDANMKIINANLHINGAHEVKLTDGTWDPSARTCKATTCHGNRTWDGDN
jgi:predicted CxxxxCH...CXXCH cytochrome family protein